MLRVCLRRLRFALLAAAATCVILLGVLAGITQLAMPWLTQHPQQVERWLSDRLDRAVTIGRLDGRWVGGGPLLSLDDVRIAGSAGSAPLLIPHAELAFDLLAAVQRNKAFSEFRLADVELRLVHADGEWRLRDFDLGASSPRDEPVSMGALGALEITRLKLAIDDTGRDLHLQFDAPILRVLNRGSVMRVLGRVRDAGSETPPLELVADLDPAERSGEIYVGGRDLDLAAFGASASSTGVRPLAGHGAVQFWLHVAAGRIEDARSRIDLKDAQFAANEPVAIGDGALIEPRASFDRLALVARWMRDADGWTLDIADFVAAADAKPARFTLERRGDGATTHWRAAASALALEPLANLAMLPARTPGELRRWLYLAHPRGLLGQAQVDLRGDAYAVSANLRGGEAASAGAIPGIEGLDVDVVGDESALLAQLPEQALRVNLPRVFRKPFAFSRFGGDLVARRSEDGWRIETDRIGFEGEGFGGELRGSVDVAAGRRPSLDLYAIATHGDVVAAKLFWPTNTMPPNAVAWLDRALVGGRIDEGRVAIHGDLADWPFHNRAGRFVAVGIVNDATLDYHEDWPPAEHIHGIATFINDGMNVEADAVTAMGNKVSAASATIEDFGPLVLDLSAKGEGTGPNLLAFLRATPIGKTYQEQLKDIAIGGRGVVGFTMKLPIKEAGALVLDGKVDLAGARIDHEAYDLHFNDANGVLRFNQKGFLADALDATFRERKAKLTVAIGGYVVDPRHVFEASVAGSWPVTSVFADVPVLLPMLGSVQGESAWTARVGVDHAVDGNARAVLALDSDLVGTAIALPPPLAKAADASTPFHLDLGLPYAGQEFSARLGTIAGMRGRAPGSGRAFGARIQFGAGVVGAPPAQGIAIGGRVARLDAGAWLDLVESGSGGPALVDSLDLRADDFVFGGREFDDTGLAIENTLAKTTIRIDGAALAGTLEVPRGDLATRGITARFARVHWPEAPADAPDAGALADVAPGSLPPLHLRVEDFQLGNASFGSAQFDSHPIAGGMQIDTLESHSPNVSMIGSGDWTGGAIENRSRMSIQLSAQNLGRMMDALGFAGLIDGGSTKATIDASWFGPPSAFALPKLDGTLAIDVAEGRILDVDPGAGRIFGLFSLTEIPRRLSLDFSDFFRSGLGFNSITGTFRLAGGNAYTDGLRIDSPAAEIIVSGRTGLRTKDYDQLMDVRARAGATLPIVGAIAAGPVGAAAGLVMQGIFNKPIGKAVARRYKVSGSWDKPHITLLSRARVGRGADAAPATEPAAEPVLPEELAPPWQVSPLGDDGGSRP
ncbi:MAG: YhdP family protein [Dokdonella sp.]|uniref:YhdP family protein n=1 Tax=Dokdonella sp. TaxID=2291710 RepID=UPI003F7F847B